MAWEELLRQHDKKKDSQTSPTGRDARDKGSLLSQVRELVGQTDAADAELPAEDESLPEQVICPDGYVRLSPVQPYTTAGDYMRRRIRKAVMIVIGVIFVGLLLYALMRSGLLIVRVR